MSDVAKRALLALKELQAKLEAVEAAKHEPIAVVGLGCRFPGANDPEAFWQLLVNGVDAIREVPAERFDVDAYYDPEPGAPGKMYTRFGGFLEAIDGFDPGFFGISGREAAGMDPQQRLLLEVAYEALEDAGRPLESLAGSRTGVFVGLMNTDYFRMAVHAPEGIQGHFCTGGISSTAAGRLAYAFNLKGPTFTLDTACSSSLLAAHLACQALRNRECDMALAAGVNALLAPEMYIACSALRMLSADGRCKTFDAAADGYVRGEGCGVVVLKRLSDAQAAGDRILGIICGSATNQDGRSAGMTAPDMLAQQAVLREALAAARVPAARVGYIEAHGTGTALGDPIEIEAIKAIYAEGAQPCFLGSVKTNIGHLESAAGVAALIKTVLLLGRGTIPPHLHLKSLNPNIELAGTRFAIPTAPQPWNAGEAPRVAAVSAFGASGSNVHMVLEAPPNPPEPATQEQPGLFVLSAHSKPALEQRARDLLAWLDQANPTLGDLCYTAGARRAHHAQRLAIAAGTLADVRRGLAAYLAGEPVSGVASGRRPSGRRRRLGWICAAAGPAWAESAREAVLPALAPCDEALAPLLGWSPAEAIAQGRRWETPSDAEVLAFCCQVALAERLVAVGIKPDALVGEGPGELAAAHLAGVLSLQEAARVLAAPDRRAALQALSPHRPRVPLISVADASPEQALASAECDAWVELAFGPGLAPQARPASAREDAMAHLATLAELYVLGWTPDWAALTPAGRLLSWPLYPWQRARYWFQAAEPAHV